MAGPDGVHLTRIQNQIGARISQRDFGEMTKFCIDVLVDELQPAKTMLLERYQIAITQWQLTERQMPIQESIEAMEEEMQDNRRQPLFPHLKNQSVWSCVSVKVFAIIIVILLGRSLHLNTHRNAKEETTMLMQLCEKVWQLWIWFRH